MVQLAQLQMYTKLIMGSKGEIKLVGVYGSPFVTRVIFALKFKSIEYEFLEENYPTKSQLLLKSNPVHKKVPILIHNDIPICESPLIVEYLDQIKPNAPMILPSDPLDRAIAKFWQIYIDQYWWAYFEELRRTPGKEGQEAYLKKIEEGLGFFEDAFVKCSRGKDYFGGDEIGFLDMCIGCYLGWLKYLDTILPIQLFDETKTPEFVKWSRKMLQHDVVKDVIPKQEVFEAFYQMILVARPSYDD